MLVRRLLLRQKKLLRLLLSNFSQSISVDIPEKRLPNRVAFSYLRLFIITAMKRIIFFVLLFSVSIIPAFSQRYANYVDSLVNSAIAASKIPGAVVCVVEGDSVAYLKAYGYRQVWPDTLPMTTNTQFDLASLSKVVGTGMSLMTLVDQGMLDIYDSIQRFLPDYQNLPESSRSLEIIDFLTHTSGLPAYAQYKSILKERPYATESERKQLLLEYMAHCKRFSLPAAEFRYSCLNFITLQYVIEVVTGMPLNRYAEQAVFRPLGMSHTCYYPIRGHHCSKQIIAPTERIAPYDSAQSVPSIIFLDKKGHLTERSIRATKACYEAIVHDPLAREINAGVSGNAGVFSTAEDLSKLAIWMLNPDSVKGPFSKGTLLQMMAIPEGYESHGRALAWDVSSDYSGCKGVEASASAVCHTGYTGTSMVVDAEKRIALIVLTNRAHPNDGGGVSALRRSIADEVFK